MNNKEVKVYDTELAFDENGNIISVVSEPEISNKKDAIIDIPEGAISMAQHSRCHKDVTKHIHATIPVINGVMIRARKSTKKNEYVEVYTEQFTTLGSNNPNAIALMHHSGDFKKVDPTTKNITKWDEKKKKLVKVSTVNCNDKSGDKKYYYTTSHVLVCYGYLEKDVTKVLKSYDLPEKELNKIKNKIIDNITKSGLILDPTDKKYKVNDGTIKTGYFLTSLFWSPSNSRNETKLFTHIRATKAFEILDKVSGGVLTEACLGNVTVDKLIKLSARLGILGAPSIRMVDIANKDMAIVIWNKKFEGPSDYCEEQNKSLESKGIKIDRFTFDGAFWASIEFIQKTFAKYGVKLTKEQAWLFAIQARANKVFSKVFGEAKDQENLKFRIEKLEALTKEEKILRLPAGSDVSKLDKKDMSNYDLIIIGNTDCIGCIMDTNGGKLLGEVSLQTLVDGNIMTYLLDIAKCSKSNMSGQALQKFLVADKEKTIGLMEKYIRRQISKLIKEKTEGDVNPHTCSLSEFILRYKDKDNTAALDSFLKQLINHIESTINNFSVEVDGYFQRVLFDESYFLTGGKIPSLLTKNEYTGRLEFYSRDLEMIYAEEILAIENDPTKSREEKDRDIANLLTAAVFKYPSPSSDENALLTGVTSGQLRRRANKLCNSGVITYEERNMLCNDFLNTSYGVIKIGADNTLKHKLAGMDTDYDGITIIFEKELVQILLDKYKGTDGVATIITE